MQVTNWGKGVVNLNQILCTEEEQYLPTWFVKSKSQNVKYLSATAIGPGNRLAQLPYNRLKTNLLATLRGDCNITSRLLLTKGRAWPP